MCLKTIADIYLNKKANFIEIVLKFSFLWCKINIQLKKQKLWG